MFAYQVRGEARPGCEVAWVDGLFPSGWYGTVAGLVEVLDDVLLAAMFVHVVGGVLVGCVCWGYCGVMLEIEDL
jgi:hypothetical protein